MVRSGAAFRGVLAGLDLAIALLIAGMTLGAMVAVYVPVPFWDEWEIFTTTDLAARLFEPHNNHRLVLFRLLAIADNELAGGTYLVQYAAILVLQAAHVLLLVLAAYCAGLAKPADLGIAAALAVGALFWRVQEQNFFWGFQSQFVGVHAAATAAFLGLALLPGWTGVAAAALAAALAAGFMANGMLVPALLVVLALWLRRPATQVIALGIFTAGLLALYFAGDYGAQRSYADPFGALHEPRQLALFIAAYIGYPVEVMLRGDLNVAIAGGVAGLALAAGTALTLLWRGGLATPARLVLLHVAAFSLATAAVTALGRARLGIEPGYITSRYATPALIFWVALALLLWSLLRQGRLRLGVPLAATGALALMLADSFHNIEGSIKLWRDHRGPAATAMLAGVRDEPQLKMTFPNYTVLPDKIEQLRDARLALFSAEWAHWRGTPLADHLALRLNDACRGKFERVEPAEEPAGQPTSGGSGWRASGWSWDEAQGGSPRWIVLTDAAGMVAGYAITDVRRPDVPAAIASIGGSDVGWRGHLRLAAPGKVTAWMIDRDAASACYIGALDVP
ncbi:hypothetical protein [Bosea sp. 117]|uniref:hypothetical protein n=1 Tax=Bosea sp. 117 TaxID=1125973 RepID=UPI000494BE70|nr:hypothetical protein [Bosea sp. 117]